MVAENMALPLALQVGTAPVHIFGARFFVAFTSWIVLILSEASLIPSLVGVVVAGRDIPGESAGHLSSYDRLCAHTLGDQLWAGVYQCVLMHVQVKPHSSFLDQQ
jgi:hypothetical protein